MNPIKSKHIIIGLAAAFIFYLFCMNGDEDYSYDLTRPQSPNQYQPSYRSMDREQYKSASSTWSPNPSSVKRHDILQSKVKGYREETYWGEHTSTTERVKNMNDDEFNDFMEEVELKDSDAYWGAEY